MESFTWGNSVQTGLVMKGPVVNAFFIACFLAQYLTILSNTNQELN